MSQFSAPLGFKVFFPPGHVWYKILIIFRDNVGSAVVDALLKDGTFTPRAIVRDLESEAALKLKERGVELAKADLLDKPSMVSALRGSEAVFLVRSVLIRLCFA